MDQTPDDVTFLAQARGRKLRDDWDAYMVETLRQLGRDTGQVKHYERKAQEYLDHYGYGYGYGYGRDNHVDTDGM